MIMAELRVCLPAKFDYMRVIKKTRITALHYFRDIGILFFITYDMAPGRQADRYGVIRCGYRLTQMFRSPQRVSEEGPHGECFHVPLEGVR